MKEVLLHPFGKGVLTADGQQYSTELVTSTDDFETVETVTVHQSLPYPPRELEFGLTMGIRSSSTTEDVIYQWQGSDDGTNWENLFTAVTYTTPGATSLDVSYSGRWAPTGAFKMNKSTFQIRAQVKSGSAGGETAKGKTKNSSYVKMIYGF